MVTVVSTPGPSLASLIAVYPNDKNDLVRQVQLALNTQLKLCLNPNGVANPDTVAAIGQFQKANKLTADGIAGPQTLSALRLTPVHNKLALSDFQSAADMLGVTVAHVRTVCDVEARGAGFLADGRPKILFERHQFYKRMITPRKPGQTAAQLQADRATFALANADICSPNTGGYVGNEGEWDRLTRARAFSDTAALESASFGLFQVMGFNAESIGYASVQTFVRAMFGSEGDQLMAFVGFLKVNPGLVAALKRKDWASFAAGYNGPGYKDNKYDTKLATAFAKYA